MTGPSLSTRFVLAVVITLAALLAASASGVAAEPERPALSVAKAVASTVSSGGFRRWLRQEVWSDADEARYSLRLDDGWQQAAAKSPSLPLVVLVHGYNSTPERNAAVMAPIRAAGYPCGAFAYPNDWDLTD